jgi:outer membrane protein OmpA-like peptidoglycan-associated protein
VRRAGYERAADHSGGITMFFRITVIALCFITATGCTPRRKVVPVQNVVLDAAPPDRDHDGIPDSVDKCPDEPETFNGYQDEDGCPDVVPVRLTFRNIHFELNSADIVDNSKSDLDTAAKILALDPAMRVRIEGHTDSYGEPSYNLDLSRRRAESVKIWLTQKFEIDAGRIETAGFGSTQPVDSLNTREGRMANRRVEFVILIRGK